MMKAALRRTRVASAPARQTERRTSRAQPRRAVWIVKKDNGATLAEVLEAQRGYLNGDRLRR